MSELTNNEATEEWVRQTYIRIRYLDPADHLDGYEFRWFASRHDGGPVDGTWDQFETEDELVEFLRYFLFKREGQIVIERLPHDEFSRRAAELDKTRRREGRLIQSFAPDSALHGL
jgi:hypothetical protein